MEDFPVQNIRCQECNEMMNFSVYHSSSEIPVFYCINKECGLNMVYLNLEMVHQSFSAIGIEKVK